MFHEAPHFPQISGVVAAVTVRRDCAVIPRTRANRRTGRYAGSRPSPFSRDRSWAGRDPRRVCDQVDAAVGAMVVLDGHVD
jgi:hypothetical protein